MNRKIIQPIASTVLIIFALLLNIKVAGGLILGDYLLKIAGLPTMSGGDSGFCITGLIVAAALMLGVILFRQYFIKYRTKLGQRLFIGLIAFAVLYQPVYNITVNLIKSQYAGLQSVEYNKADSICTYSLTPTDDYIECHCSLKFINYSYNTKEFQIEPKLLKEQIAESLNKYFKINANGLEYVKGECFLSLPPVRTDIFTNPPVIPVDLEFRFKQNDKSRNVNGTGRIEGPSITIFNKNDTKSFE